MVVPVVSLRGDGWGLRREYTAEPGWFPSVLPTDALSHPIDGPSTPSHRPRRRHFARCRGLLLCAVLGMREAGGSPPGGVNKRPNMMTYPVDRDRLLGYEAVDVLLLRQVRPKDLQEERVLHRRPEDVNWS